ncbi:MAG: hypothetical protein ACYC5O_00790 [Anaerolineae bacterium]
MELQLYGVGGAGLILAIVELLKRSVGLPTRYAGLVAVGLGLVLACLLKLDDPSVASWLQVELAGLVAGLTAAGVWSATKAAAGR